MKRIVATLAFLSVLGCGQITPQSSTQPLIAPGSSTLTHPWKWTPEGASSAELKTTIDNLKTPEQISVFLQNNITWKEDYDTSEFLSPNQVVADKRTVCTGFARFWQYALAKNGYNSHFVAVWGPTSAHAFVVFKFEGQWRLASNQYYYNRPEQKLGTIGEDYLETAAQKGSIEFYGAGWRMFEIYDANGNITDRKENSTAPTLITPGTIPGRNLFSIKR